MQEVDHYRWMTTFWFTDASTVDTVVVESQGLLLQLDGAIKLGAANSASVGVVGMFLGELFKIYPGYVDAWIAAWEPIAGTAIDALVLALWRAQRLDHLERLAAEHPDVEPFLTLTPELPAVTRGAHLDMRWGVIFATGDVEAHKQIVETSKWFSEPTQKGAKQRMQRSVAVAAAWSASSLGGQYPPYSDMLAAVLEADAALCKAFNIVVDHVEASGGDWHL